MLRIFKSRVNALLLAVLGLVLIAPAALAQGHYRGQRGARGGQSRSASRGFSRTSRAPSRGFSRSSRSVPSRSYRSAPSRNSSRSYRRTLPSSRNVRRATPSARNYSRHVPSRTAGFNRRTSTSRTAPSVNRNRGTVNRSSVNRNRVHRNSVSRYANRGITRNPNGFRGTRSSRTPTRLNSADAWRLRNGSATSDLRRRNQAPRTAAGTTRGVRRDHGAVRRSTSRGFYRDSHASRRHASRGHVSRGHVSRGHASRHGHHRHRHHGHHHRYHDYYRHHGWSLSFAFGYGSYVGLSYYYPYRHYGLGVDFAFFYPGAVSYAYVPYGFYCDAPVEYVERVKYVYPTTEVVVVESDEPVEAGEKVLEPVPAAGSPTTEKFLREGSEDFRKGDYYEAAKKFRLAALSAPKQAGPLFALGQALVALGSDTYAARVIRRAVAINPGLVKEPGDIMGVYPSQAEFEKALERMVKLAERRPPHSDAHFVVAVQRFFSGDPRARGDFAKLAGLLPEDDVVALFADAATKRFATGEAALPPIEKTDSG